MPYLLLPILLLQLAADPQPTPARGLDALRVPAAFTAEIAVSADLSAYPMFMELDEVGNLYIAESSGKDISGKDMVAAPECLILKLHDNDRDGRYDTRTIFADTLSLPMGVCWFQGALYVASPPEFIRFEDTDGDGRADKRDVLLSGWNILNTASLHGPYIGPDGWMYLTHGRHGFDITTREGKRLEGKAARIWRCRPDGSQLETYCGGGFDNPIEIVFNEAGETIGTMTYFVDPSHGQRDGLMHWVEGGCYPKPYEVTAEFIRTGDLMPVMTRFARIAPSGLARYRGAAFGPEYHGNLFSAQFNPNRVQRHVVFREGATFRTEDSDFITSTDPDFRPTDVLEDADGSLLVSDTGGWYVDACPLSRIARPESRGAIFRIRRDSAESPTDPYGLEIPWDTAPAAAIAARLADHRPRVQDRAVEVLVQRGGEATQALREALARAQNPEARARALWALHRIGGPTAREAIRAALGDASPVVRIAAARAIGLAPDPEASEVLASALSDADLGVRRQAATALGQIAAREAVTPLLAAAQETTDRFLEHALIFSLIQLAEIDTLRAALQHPALRARKAALIALDQRGAAISEAEFAPFLAEEDENVRHAALWVASRHPEWSPTVAGFIEERLRAADFDPATAAPLRELMLAYAASPEFQKRVDTLLSAANVDAPRKEFLLDTIDLAPLKTLPAPWLSTLARLLRVGSPELRGKVVALARTRSLDAFDTDLAKIVDADSEAISLRLAALGALLPRAKSLSQKRYALVVERLGEEHPPTERQAAAKLLADAELSPAQRADITQRLLPSADALTFPALLDCFRGSDDDTTGMALVHALTENRAQVERLPAQRLEDLLGPFSPAVQAAAKPLRAKAEADAQARIAKLQTLEPHLGAGDVGRGREVFFGPKAACSTCHSVGDEGGILGPDLTSIGAIRSPHDLLEAVLFPSASLVMGYETYLVETFEEIHLGTLARQEAEAVVLRTAVGQDIRVPRGDIVKMEQYPISKMPDGLDSGLSQPELIDLMTFLISLNGESWLQPVRFETKP